MCSLTHYYLKLPIREQTLLPNKKALNVITLPSQLSDGYTLLLLRPCQPLAVRQGPGRIVGEIAEDRRVGTGVWVPTHRQGRAGQGRVVSTKAETAMDF